MNKEVELKAKVANPELIRKWLTVNCEPIKKVFQEDILYDYKPKSFIQDSQTLKADEFMRTRCTNDEDSLTHKIIKRDDSGSFLYCDEYESVINKDNFSNVRDILDDFNCGDIQESNCDNGRNLGLFLTGKEFSEIMRISKKRDEYKTRDFNVSLDEVDGLGCFIEVESFQKTADEKSVKIIKNKMMNFLKDIQIYSDSIIKKGYLDLMVEKNRGKHL